MIFNLSHYKKLDNALIKTDKQIPFTLINPVNEKEEKEKFFSSDKYEPVFKYKKHDLDIISIQSDLNRLNFKDSILDDIFLDKKKKILNFVDLVNSRGKKYFTDISIDIYGKPDAELCLAARNLVKLEEEKVDEPIIPLNKVKRMFKMAMFKQGFNWKIQEKEMPALAAVLASKKTFYLRKDAEFTLSQVKRLIVHEIGTHVLRAENGSHQPFKIFKVGLPNYIQTEEGLAVYNEERHDLQTNKVLKTYAGRVLAIDHALHTGFRTTYNFLRKWFDEDLSWRLTVRAKRGLIDTHQAGAYTKDLAYLKGYLDVKEYIKKGGNIDNLYYGKIGIEHVELLPEIPYIIPPKVLPLFQYVNFLNDLVSQVFEYSLDLIAKPITIPAKLAISYKYKNHTKIDKKTSKKKPNSKDNKKNKASKKAKSKKDNKKSK